MKRFATSKHLSPKQFLRAVWISLDQFSALRDQIIGCIQAEPEAQPMKKRGKKAVTLPVEDQLLLTLTSLRHYPTCAPLGLQFGLWESSAHKVYQQYRDRLVNGCRLPGRRSLLDEGLGAILVEVTEQPIARPIRQQRAWYSGKKTADHQNPTSRLSV
jgi:hypothetical protein